KYTSSAILSKSCAQIIFFNFLMNSSITNKDFSATFTISSSSSYTSLIFNSSSSCNFVIFLKIVLLTMSFFQKFTKIRVFILKSAEPQFFFTALDVIGRAYSIDLIEQIREILTGCNAAFLSQSFNSVVEVLIVGIEQMHYIFDPKLCHIFIKVHSFIFIDVYR